MENNEQVKMVVALDEYFIFDPVLFLPSETGQFTPFASYRANNDIYNVSVVSDYTRSFHEPDAVMVDKEVLDRYLAVRQEFFALNSYFENLYRKQEGLDK